MAGITQRQKVAILGANGRLGRMVRACGDTCELIPVVRPDKVKPGELAWAPGLPVPTDLHCDAVLALWGVLSGPSEALAENTTLAHAAQAFGAATLARQVVHCSSSAVYGAQMPWTETRDPAPQTAYGIAKAAMERSLRQTARGPRSVVLRIGNVAGADSLFAAGQRDGRITLDQFPDGRGPQRSYIGPRALTRVLLWAALDPAAPALLNVAAPGEVGMAAMAEAMDWPVTWHPAPQSAMQRAVLDTGLLQDHLALPKESGTAKGMAQELRSIGWNG